MANIVNLFLDSTDFSTATAIYTDIDLTIKAPDGYYTYGTLNRQQLGGVLQAGVECSTIPPCPEPVDCVVSEWSAWSVCSGGTQTRTRTIITPASGGGTPCPVLEESQACTLPLSATCFEGYWELNDPQHPNGGYVTYVDANGDTVTQNNIWLGDLVTINNNSIVDYGGANITTCPPDVICINYTISTTAAFGTTTSYLDCLGNEQQVTIGGVSGYDATTFCAIENSVNTGAETNLTANGPCV